MTRATQEALAIVVVLGGAIVFTVLVLRALERRLQLPGTHAGFNPELTRSPDAPIDLIGLREKMRGALPVRSSVFLPTNKLYRAKLDGREEIVGHSDETIAQLLRGVVWHEWPINCPTWTGDSIGGAGGAGCKCDVEEGLP